MSELNTRMPDTAVAQWSRTGESLWSLTVFGATVARVFAKLDENGFADFKTCLPDHGEAHFSNLRGAQKYVEDIIWPASKENQ